MAWGLKVPVWRACLSLLFAALRRLVMTAQNVVAQGPPGTAVFENDEKSNPVSSSLVVDNLAYLLFASQSVIFSQTPRAELWTWRHPLHRSLSGFVGSTWNPKRPLLHHWGDGMPSTYTIDLELKAEEEVIDCQGIPWSNTITQEPHWRW